MKLIMDIGMNNGRDSLFYLQKGFKVVAVEANPLLVKEAEVKFSEYIRSGQLIIEPVGISSEAGLATFYLNLDKDDWSSFIHAYGTRNNTRYKEVIVKCITPETLFQKHGIPYYLKIDIEGSDLIVAQALHAFQKRPKFISMEESDASNFAELWSLGYRSFQLVNQQKLFETVPPFPAREGEYVEAKFDGTTSGLFGEELEEGEWLTFAQALEVYLNEVRSPTRGYLGDYYWFDIHARIENS